VILLLIVVRCVFVVDVVGRNHFVRRGGEISVAYGEKCVNDLMCE